MSDQNKPAGHSNIFNKGKSADQTQILQLSLFLILLAFFIVLNVSSNYDEERVKPVIKSLYKAFSSNLVPIVDDPDETPITVKFLKQEQAVDYIRELFKSELPAADVKTNQELGLMRAQMGRPVFEERILSKGSSSLDRIIAAMIYLKEQGRPYSIEIQLSYKNETDINKAVIRLDRYAKMLERRGVDDRFLSLSMVQSKRRDVTMLFRPHIAYVPEVNE